MHGLGEGRMRPSHKADREGGIEVRVPLPWLREYCDPDLDVQAIEQRLTMTGTKVEAIHHHGVPSAEHFVLGRVLSAEPHPDADRLRVCSVELGLPERPGDDRVRRAQRRRQADGGGRVPGRGDARRHEARHREAARSGLRRDDPRRERARH